MAIRIDGKIVAQGVLADVAAGVRRFVDTQGAAPGLAVVLIGADPASEIYVRRKIDACDAAGIRSHSLRLEENVSQAALLGVIDALNGDRSIHGILVQLPLPKHIDAAAVLDVIDPRKDVDGFHPVNVGRLSTVGDGLVPCTPLGCIRLLDTAVDDFRGRRAVVVGKSNIVGKPMALLLLERECTVSVAHIATRDLPDLTRTADILVVAAGSPGLIRGGWVKPGAIVIDVGINRVVRDGRVQIVGDVRQAEMDHAAAITPVPGGVGPMTIACLMENALRAANALVFSP